MIAYVYQCVRGCVCFVRVCLDAYMHIHLFTRITIIIRPFCGRAG